MIIRSLVIIILQTILTALPKLQADTLPFDDSSCMRHLKAYFQTNQSITITTLQGGLSSTKNYKITHNGLEYVLRIFDPAVSAKERQQEMKAAKFAEKLGIAPLIHYVSPGYDAMIMDF